MSWRTGNEFAESQYRYSQYHLYPPPPQNDESRSTDEMLRQLDQHFNPPPQEQTSFDEELLEQLTQLLSAYAKFTKSRFDSLGRSLGHLSKAVVMLAEQQARAQVCEQVAPPLATVEAVSIHTEDGEVEVCMEEIPVEEDKEKDDEETPLQVLAPIAQSADCGELGNISSFSFPSNTICRRWRIC